MAANTSHSVVEYFGGDSGYRCGYCKHEGGNFSHGMWSHTMTVQDYQDLIDRGWRRSGKYVYKPTLDKTCCPQYTIRCHALKFQPSKSHKKVLKKMSKFLSKGELPTGQDDGEPMDSLCGEAAPREASHVCRPEVTPAAIADIQQEGPERPDITGAQQEVQESPVITGAQQEVQESPVITGAQQEGPDDSQTSRKNPESVAAERTTAAAPQAGRGADPGRPPRRKAKDLRKERRLQKEGGRDAAPAAPHRPKALEDFLREALPDGAPHRLEVRLVPVSFEDPQFSASYQQSVALYAGYQMAVHGDDPSECSESEFRRFLCDSPLEAERPPDGPQDGYGSFHQQYLLDGRLVAVGVVDVLPTCVSSVYFYYHPDFASLSLGSYSALREISFTRRLQLQSPRLCYYYLGFYIHSCPKMRYKGQYRPSDLLCPETFAWVQIERCLLQLESARYARFNPDPDAGDPRRLQDVGRALVLHRGAVMPYAAYSRKRKGSSDEAEVRQYADLVGQGGAERILLYRA